MASFCNSGDTFCDSGNSLAVHLAYIQSNGADATNFIVKMTKTAPNGTV
jgi:acetylxylan esterase